MAGVVKNLMVRAGADFSAITDQSKKASKAVGSMQNSVTRSCSGMSQAAGALKKAFTFTAVAYALRKLYQAGRDAAEAYDQQAEAETKLAQVMRNTMRAGNSEIQSILDLASAQQKLGVISDEVQLAGAQELASYLSLSSSLQTLIPVMNDMAAQQYGYNVTAEQTTTIATMLGKVMNGQTSALSRYGYSFDAAQEKILKFGNEEQRAAVLAQVVTQSVGGMNQALAQTPTGRMKQLSNTMGDIKEKFGQAARTVGTVFLPLLNKMADILAAVATLANKVAQAIANVFGGKAAGSEWKYLPGSMAVAEDSAEGISDSIDSTTDSIVAMSGGINAATAGIDSAASGMKDLAEATQKATKAAEEYRSQADFDKLHVLSFPKEGETDSGSDSTGTGSGDYSGSPGAGDYSGSPGSTGPGAGDYSGSPGSTGPGASILETESAWEETSGESIGWLEKLLSTVKEKWEEFTAGLDLSRLSDAFGQLKDAMAPIIGDIGDGLVWLWDNALKPLATWTINEAAPRLVEVLANAFRVLYDVFDLLRPVLEAIWPVLKWMAEIAGFAITAALDQVNQVLKDLHAVLSGDADPLTRMRVALYGLEALSLGGLIGCLIELVNTAGEFAVVFGRAATAADAFSLALGTAGLMGTLGVVTTGTSLLTTALGAAGGAGLLATLTSGAGVVGSFGASLTGTMVPALTAGTAAEGAAAAGATGLLGPIAAVIAIVVALGITIYECVKHWDEIKEAAGKAADWTKQKWQGFGEWFKSKVWTPIETNAKLLWAALPAAAELAKEGIRQKFQNIKDWFKDKVFDPVKEIAKEGFNAVKTAGLTVANGIVEDYQKARDRLGEAFAAIQSSGRAALSLLSSLGRSAGETLLNAFQRAHSTITSLFGPLGNWFKTSVFSPIVEGAKGMVEKISNAFERFSNKLSDISGKIHSAISSIGGKISGGISNLNITLPGLASGAVIPPNREFAAVLGDQRSGVNIETPERLLRQIMRQEMAPITGIRTNASETLSAAVHDGSANGMLLRTLDEILEAIMDGHDIVMDDVRFGKAVRRANRQQSRIGGAARIGGAV